MWHTNAKPSCIFPRERINSCYDKCEICFTVFSIFYLSGFAHLSFTFLPSAAFGKSSLSFLSHKTINMHATQHSLILILLCKWLNIAIFWLSFFPLLVNLDSLWNDFHTFTPHISRRPSSKPTGFFKHLFCTSSFLHTLHLSANPLFITTWSYRVFTPLIINFVKEFHHSSAAVVCWEAQSCFSPGIWLIKLYWWLNDNSAKTAWLKKKKLKIKFWVDCLRSHYFGEAWSGLSTLAAFCKMKPNSLLSGVFCFLPP